MTCAVGEAVLIQNKFIEENRFYDPKQSVLGSNKLCSAGRK